MWVGTQTVQKVLVYGSWGQLSTLGTEAEAASRYKVWVFLKWNVNIGSWGDGNYEWGTQPSPPLPKPGH